MSESFISFHQVQKIMDSKTIIHDFSMTIARGQIIALCGGNGAGKSTILRLLAGVIHPNQGSISIDNLRWKDHRLQYAKMIGYMPDDYQFSKGMTALETMIFWAKLKGLDQHRAEEVLSDVGILPNDTRNVSSYSKGMRQRVLFAQALLAQSPVLILDEPTNGLDPYWMETFIQIIQNVASRGQTVVFSTHQLHIAEILANRIVFLREGSIVHDELVEKKINHNHHSSLYDTFLSISGISTEIKK